MLLTELSNSEDGNILENDKLIATLETLKKESAEIKAEMDQAEVTLQEIEEVLGVYRPLSSMSSRIFFTLQALGGVHYLYQYSLQQYMDVLMGVLSQTEELQALPKSQHDKRLEVMTKAMFVKFNQSFSQGLLEAHQQMFAVRLAQIRIQGDAECTKIYDLFLNPRALPDPKSMSTGILSGKLTRV
jgi:dynein heavy chain 1